MASQVLLCFILLFVLTTQKLKCLAGTSGVKILIFQQAGLFGMAS